MNQVPVKWVHPTAFLNKKQADLMSVHHIPVVELAALRKVVEGLKKQYRGEACYIYKEAFSDLLASLGEA